jgi:glycosyltransferase involved in cell wall biosynthesis
MTVITNGYDPERFPAEAGRAEPSPTDPLSIVYTGQFYADRHPGGLLDAIQSLRQDPPPGMPALRVEFFGKPDTTVDVAGEIRRRGLEDVVSLKGHVPYAESLRIMTRADVLLLVDQPGRLRGVPAKLYEYLGAGRPVLAMVEPDSDTAWVLEQSDIPYRMAAPTDARGIRQALIELVLAARSSPRGASREGRLAFTRPRLTAALAELLDQCVASRAEGRPVGDLR